MKQLVLEVLHVAVRVAVPVLAFSIGLGAGEARLRPVLAHKGLLVRSLVAVLVVVPVAAVLMVKLLPLGPAVSSGLLVMALSAGPAMAIFKASRVGADKSYAFVLDVSLLVLSLFFVPAAVALLGVVFQRPLHFGVLDVAKVLLPLQLLPLLAGALVARVWPSFAKRAERPLWLGAIAAVVLVALVVLVAMARPLLAIGAPRLFAIAAFALFAVAAGHALGGPEESTRRLLATFSGMRFPALALALATLSEVKEQVVPVVLAYLLFTLVVLAIYAALARRSGAVPGRTAGAQQ